MFLKKTKFATTGRERKSERKNLADMKFLANADHWAEDRRVEDNYEFTKHSFQALLLA